MGKLMGRNQEIDEGGGRRSIPLFPSAAVDANSTAMLFEDGKKAVVDVVAALKEA
ncbi:MAG: hypothetical protein AB7L90_26150 [Hyphomicrobiaceae bacterium]